MPDESSRQQDLVLAPNEQATILDTTKGIVTVYVGPQKTTPSNTDQPVRYDENEHRFVRCLLAEATQLWPVASEGDYIVLQNPGSPGQYEHPKGGAASNLPELDVGRKVNVHGPATFPLWPGQVADVVPGHRLRSNEYLIIEVYNDDAARENWGQSVIKRQTEPAARQSSEQTTPPEASTSGEGNSGSTDPALPTSTVATTSEIPNLTVGQRLIVPGTEVSFYMPPTGVLVVQDDEGGEYVRQAVTLERLEFCILIDEGGNKRYVQGPAVVFPEPTESFVREGTARKFRATELSPISGVYVKVIAEYDDDDGHHDVGQELFITGNDQPIYFPRSEHALIKYGEQNVYHAVAIPAGEGRYVLERLTGEVRLVEGPRMFLPDPRTQVLVRRVLTPQQVELWFPGNTKALEYNREAALTQQASDETILTERSIVRGLSAESYSPRSRLREQVGKMAAGDDFRRGETYTPPRTIVLDTKYEGAVAIDVWPQYAVMVTSRSGERRVVVGPATVLLTYDETLVHMNLSTGTPKSDDRTVSTSYLQVLNNRVSDVIDAETQDLVQVQVRLSYRVNFEGGNPGLWFAADNYVKLLTDHMRSLIRSAVKRISIKEFYGNSTAVIRDTVLGQPSSESKRPGRPFTENGMRVYDVEVLDVKITDHDISHMLQDAQQQAVKVGLELDAEERRLYLAKRREEIRQEEALAQDETASARHEITLAGIGRLQKEEEAGISAKNASDRMRREAELALQEILDNIAKAVLVRRQEEASADVAMLQAQQQVAQEQLRAEVQAVVDKAGAITPDMIAALQAFGDKDLLAKVTSSMAPLAIIDRISVATVLEQLFQNTPLVGLFNQANQNLGSNNGRRAAIREET